MICDQIWLIMMKYEYARCDIVQKDRPTDRQTDRQTLQFSRKVTLPKTLGGWLVQLPAIQMQEFAKIIITFFIFPSQPIFWFIPRNTDRIFLGFIHTQFLEHTDLQMYKHNVLQFYRRTDVQTHNHYLFYFQEYERICPSLRYVTLNSYPNVGFIANKLPE